MNLRTDSKALQPLLFGPSESLDDALPLTYSRTTEVTVMPRARKEWRVRHGPSGCGYLDTIQSSCTVCQSVPDNKKANRKG